MHILVTGGFGNVGVRVVDECLARGHAVTVFDVASPRAERLGRRYGRVGVRVRIGDVRRPDDLAEAVAGQDAIIHLAAILPPTSERLPELCDAVNVGGTRNLVEAARALDPAPAFVEVSSASVMGPTQHRDGLVGPGDPVNPVDAYTRSKAAAEAVVAWSGLDR